MEFDNFFGILRFTLQILNLPSSNFPKICGFWFMHEYSNLSLSKLTRGEGGALPVLKNERFQQIENDVTGSHIKMFIFRTSAVCLAFWAALKTHHACHSARTHKPLFLALHMEEYVLQPRILHR
jgi:hypothetical protein